MCIYMRLPERIKLFIAGNCSVKTRYVSSRNLNFVGLFEVNLSVYLSQQVSLWSNCLCFAVLKRHINLQHIFFLFSAVRLVIVVHSTLSGFLLFVFFSFFFLCEAAKDPTYYIFYIVFSYRMFILVRWFYLEKVILVKWLK